MIAGGKKDMVLLEKALALDLYDSSCRIEPNNIIPV